MGTTPDHAAGAAPEGGRSSTGGSASPGAGGTRPPAGPPLDIRTAWEDSADAVDPRALHLATRRRRRNARVLAGMATLLVAVVAGLLLVSALRDGSGGMTTAATEEAGRTGVEGGDGTRAVSPDPQTLPPPPGLEEVAEGVWSALPAYLSTRIDSLREEQGLEEAPPRAWLSGYYLANADEFPEVVTFWQDYAAFIRVLDETESELIRAAALDALEGLDAPQPAPSDAEAPLLAWVAAREERSGPLRRDRYLHLERTAVAALQLHGFLVEYQASIAWSPAVGQGVSVDPVLEAVTESPEVRRQLERHLDRVFEALDRTRGGGQPSLAGLRAELFGSLGRPL